MLVMVFRRAGWDVLAAADGKEAMRLFHGSPDIDLVILDVEMSNGHATKIFRQMRRTRPALPGLCVTSGMNQETSEELRAAGIRATFHKPFKLHTLIQEATAALDVSRS
jgi:DNA-binding response OmpR family regulator